MHADFPRNSIHLTVSYGWRGGDRFSRSVGSDNLSPHVLTVKLSGFRIPKFPIPLSDPHSGIRRCEKVRGKSDGVVGCGLELFRRNWIENYLWDKRKLFRSE